MRISDWSSDVCSSDLGLGESLARMLVARIGRSYLTVLAGLALGCIGLSFLMPSVMGRVLLLVPIVVALSDSLGYAEGSRGRAGIVRSEVHTSELQSLMRISYAVFC